MQESKEYHEALVDKMIPNNGYFNSLLWWLTVWNFLQIDLVKGWMDDNVRVQSNFQGLFYSFVANIFWLPGWGSCDSVAFPYDTDTECRF